MSQYFTHKSIDVRDVMHLSICMYETFCIPLSESRDLGICKQNNAGRETQGKEEHKKESCTIYSLNAYWYTTYFITHTGIVNYVIV
jgi:hypothetical protein